MATEEENVICSVCQATFTRKTHLNRHMRAHWNQRTYNCHHCGKATFTRSDLLGRHLKRCSQGPPGVPITRKKACRVCVARKVKCDLQKPCGKCVARGDECLYDTYTKDDSPELFQQGSSQSAPKTTGSWGDLGTQEGSSSSATNQQPSHFISSDLSLSHEASMADPMGRQASGQSGGAQAALSDSGVAPAFFNATTHLGSEVDIFTGGASLDFSGFSSYFNSQPFDFTNAFGVLDSSLLPSFSQPSTSQPMPSIPQSLPQFPDVLRDTYIDAGTEERDKFIKLFLSHHIQNNPIFHLQTWTLDSSSQLLQTTMAACGALFANDGKADMRIKKALRSELRQQIFRQFIQLPGDDTDGQLDLMSAMVTIQTAGLWHKDPVERSISAGYHGMLILMVRRSSLASFVEQWRPPPPGNIYGYDCWKSWARFESAKRVIMQTFLFDCLMPVFFNLPPSLMQQDVNVLLPCDDTLWKAATEEEWSTEASKLETDLRGVNLTTICQYLYDPTTTMPPMNDLSTFVILHALFRSIYQAAGTNNASLLAVLQTMLTRWYNQFVQGSRSAVEVNVRNLTFASLPLYWLAQIIHEEKDRKDLQRQGEQHLNMLTQWIRDFWPLLGENLKDNSTQTSGYALAR